MIVIVRERDVSVSVIVCERLSVDWSRVRRSAKLLTGVAYCGERVTRMGLQYTCTYVPRNEMLMLGVLSRVE